MQYFESSVYGEWCKRVYGNDMKQMGMVTDDELELFFHNVTLSPNSHILDIGSGPGYITAAVAAHYKSYVTGIDIDSEAIAHAKTIFTDNPTLSFQVLDGNEIAYNEQSFDLIYFFDTLYFTQSIEKLRSILDKCLSMLKLEGKLVVFWTNNPNKQFNIFDMPEPTVNNTQVAIWGLDNHLDFNAINLTESHRSYWHRAMAEVKTMANELTAEIPEHYKTLLDECTYFSGLCEKGDAGGLFRWLLIFDKK